MSHGAVKSYSLMGVVRRDQARRGQPVAKRVTQPMPDWDRESHREKVREMLARVEEVVGDDDKLLVEYQQDIDIDTGMESKLPMLEFHQEFDQELKDCVEVPRRVSRRVLRRGSLRESLRVWLRVQVCFRESLRGSFRVWLRVYIFYILTFEHLQFFLKQIVTFTFYTWMYIHIYLSLVPGPWSLGPFTFYLLPFLPFFFTFF